MTTSLRSATNLGLLASVLASLGGCATAEQIFIGSRLPILCDETYFTCNVTAGCELDEDHYIRGSFPGTRRMVVISDQAADTVQDYRVRLFLTEVEAPGTELLVQFYEPDCSLDPQDARIHEQDFDIIEEAGNDRTVIYEDIRVQSRGEHLVEIFSDASVDYLLIIEPQ